MKNSVTTETGVPPPVSDAPEWFPDDDGPDYIIDLVVLALGLLSCLIIYAVGKYRAKIQGL